MSDQIKGKLSELATILGDWYDLLEVIKGMKSGWISDNSGFNKSEIMGAQFVVAEEFEKWWLDHRPQGPRDILDKLDALSLVHRWPHTIEAVIDMVQFAIISLVDLTPNNPIASLPEPVAKEPASEVAIAWWAEAPPRLVPYLQEADKLAMLPHDFTEVRSKGGWDEDRKALNRFLAKHAPDKKFKFSVNRNRLQVIPKPAGD